jgi:low affinity Fe/Cu permease
MHGEHKNHKDKSLAVRIGDRVSDWTSKLFAHPYMQVGVIVFCASWFIYGLRADLLTAALSILAITLTQMVLNSQYDREMEAHRRDVAMHAKLDELLISMKGARNEMAGIEDLEEEDIEELKDEVTESIDEAGPGAGHTNHRATAKTAAARAIDATAKAKTRRDRKGTAAKA